jgi:ribosomal protein S18 acetylase RimI-like enzyme
VTVARTAPNAVTLRRATVADADVVADVYLTSRRHAAPRIPRTVHSDDDVRAWFASIVLVEYEAWVAETPRGVAGLMVLRGDSLDHLYVRPEFQRQGVGARLLDHAKRRRPRGLRLYTFEANHPARDFYEKHGFRAIAFGDGTGNEEGAADVLYEWSP